MKVKVKEQPSLEARGSETAQSGNSQTSHKSPTHLGQTRDGGSGRVLRKGLDTNQPAGGGGTLTSHPPSRVTHAPP